MIKLSFKCLLLGVLAGGLWFYNGYAFSQAEPTRIVVARQPDSPLLILPTYIDSSNPLSPRYGYSVTNTGDKPIRAYTIQESVSLDTGAPIIRTTLAHAPTEKQFLAPHDSKQERGGVGATYKSPPLKIELAVDFIEFADGSRWGTDTSESGDRLDGMRAGGKAAIKRYREILSARGISGVEEALTKTDLIQPEIQPKSHMWAIGFKTGASIVKSRLQQARDKKGQDEVKRELTKPFDSTEGRTEK